MYKNLAIIPVKLGSKRLPRKNLRDFYGKPLFTYAVNNAINSNLFSEVHVSTESEEVALKCEELGIKPLFLRPEELATDSATIQQVCEFAIDEYQKRSYQFENFCILWATAPLNTSQDIINAYSMLSDDTDGVVSVTEYDLPVYCAQFVDAHNNLSPVFPDKLRLPSSQMPKIVCDNGAFCWVKTQAFKKHKTWLPPKLKGYNMPKSRSADIDTQSDWDWTSFLYQKMILKQEEEKC